MTGKRTTSETVVVVAMGLVTGAGALALYLHAGLPGPVAATAALSVYLLLLTVHTFIWRKAAKTAEQAPSPLDRRDLEVRRLQDAERQAANPAAVAAAARPSRPQPPQAMAPQRPAAAAPQNDPRARAFETASEAAYAAAPQRAQVPPRIPTPSSGPVAAERATPPSLPPRAPQPQATQNMPPQNMGPQTLAPQNLGQVQEEMQDYWSFRPAAPKQDLPPFVTGRAAARPAAPLQAEPQLGPQQHLAATPQPARQASPAHASSPREADVEIIQDAIKRLLDEVNAAEKHETRARQQPPGPPPLPQFTPQPPSAENAIDRSVDALRMTADSMRASFGQREASIRQPIEQPSLSTPAASRTAGPPPPPSPPPMPPFVRGAQHRVLSASDALARVMADAISAGRIDVTLEPILGLEDQQTRHYEVSIRLRDSEGNPLDISPEGPDLRGTGLLPLFDGVRIVRTAAVARRLEERGKAGSIFSAFSGESVADEHFLGELAETLHQRSSLVSQLVLSFSQTDVRGFSTPEWDSLADMRSLGFRFALSAVTDLDMDFEALAEQGFAFVKLDADVFLHGLRAPSGHIPSSDVCRHLAKLGHTLVVEHIDDDDKLARVFGFGALLGQGQLFGGARPVRADIVTGRSGYAAA